MTAHPPVTRRAVLAGVAAISVGDARAAGDARIVSLDWGWAATLIGLGVVPLGVAEQRLYRDWVVTPALPDGIAEIGLRTSPSLETLAALKPDLILTNGLDAAIAPRLATIAPILPSPIYSTAKTPLINAIAAARLLGDRLGRRPAAEAVVADAERRIDAARERLKTLTGRPFLLLTILDRQHATIYGPGSLFGDVIRAVGLRDLWSGSTSVWGHATRSLADLATQPPGDVLLIGALPPSAAGVLDAPGLFPSLCAAAGRRIHRLPSSWGFGDITAAARFADLLADGLAAEARA